MKIFLLKRSSLPLQRQDQIKEPRELQIQALPSPFSKLHRLHFPSSTDSIFQAPPSPFSKLHRPHFPGSTVSIFQAPPSAFSHVTVSYNPWIMDSSVSFCDNLSKLLKSFLLKKLLRPLRRLEQPMMSIETLKIAQDKQQLITNGTHTPIISQLPDILKYNNSLLLPVSAISNQRIEFTNGLLALLWHKICPLISLRNHR